MKISIALIFLLVFSSSAHARRPITSCEKAPLLAEFQKQLPDHLFIRNSKTDVQLKFISNESATGTAGMSVYRRLRQPLICIVVAVDATGTVEDAAISYPAGSALLPKERDMLKSIQLSPAILNGKALPILFNIIIGE